MTAQAVPVALYLAFGARRNRCQPARLAVTSLPVTRELLQRSPSESLLEDLNVILTDFIEDGDVPQLIIRGNLAIHGATRTSIV